VETKCPVKKKKEEKKKRHEEKKWGENGVENGVINNIMRIMSKIMCQWKLENEGLFQHQNISIVHP